MKVNEAAPYNGVLLFGASSVPEKHHLVPPSAYATLHTAALPDGLLVVADAYAFLRANPTFKRDVKLVLLAASPLLGTASELVALINLLRRNEKLSQITPPDDAWLGAMRCYVQFAPLFHQLFLTLAFQPPKHLIDYAPDLQRRALNVYPVRCSHHQIQAYRSAASERDKLLALTMSYPKPFDPCVVYVQDKFFYTTNEKVFANLEKYSRKLQHVVAAAQTCAGRVLVYARFLNSALPAALALEEAGFRRPGRPMLTGTGPANGLHYIFISRDARLSPNNAGELLLPDVKVVVLVEGSTSYEFKNICQFHVLDAAPSGGKVAELVARNGAAQLVLYASLIDLDEEALDMYMYRQAETQRAQIETLLCPKKESIGAFLKLCFKEKLVFTRAELLRKVPWPRAEVAAALTALVQSRAYVVDRFGTCGPVGRFDDYYAFEPIVAPNPMEETYLQARGFLKVAHRTWGRMAACALQGVPEAQQDRVVVAHVLECAGPVERDQLFARVRERCSSKFDELALAHLTRVELTPPYAETVGTLDAGGLVLLKGAVPRDLQGDREMVRCAFELKLRLLDAAGPLCWFLSPEAARKQKELKCICWPR